MATQDAAVEATRLQVASAHKQDVGKGAARMSKAAFQALGLQPGQIIEIQGEKNTAAIAVPPYAQDEGLSIIRLDGFQCANAGAGLGDHVEVARAEVQPAKKVTLAPAQQNLRIRGSGQGAAAHALPAPARGRRRHLHVGLPADAKHGPQPVPGRGLPRLLQQRAFGLQEIRLMVTSTTPRSIVQVTEDTEIELAGAVR